MKSILLDTNAYSSYIAGDRKVKKSIVRSDKVVLSAVTIGELYIGFFNGSRFIENESNFLKFISDIKVSVVRVGKKTAKIYAKIAIDLYRHGTPIPVNDIWIAAQVFETGSVLVTYDKHFLKIPKLRVWGGLK